MYLNLTIFRIILIFLTILLSACANMPDLPSRFQNNRIVQTRLLQAPSSVSGEDFSVWTFDPNNGNKIISNCHTGGNKNPSLDNCITWFNKQTYPRWFRFTVPDKGIELRTKINSVELAIIDLHYQDNGDGTITDNNTGLMWKRCSEGQSWNGYTCQGDAEMMRFVQAMPNGGQKPWPTFAGYSDWRVPFSNELLSLQQCSGKVVEGKGSQCMPDEPIIGPLARWVIPAIPPINQIAFPNARDLGLLSVWGSVYWTTNSFVDFSTMSHVHEAFSGRVRLVRATQIGMSQPPPIYNQPAEDVLVRKQSQIDAHHCREQYLSGAAYQADNDSFKFSAAKLGTCITFVPEPPNRVIMVQFLQSPTLISGEFAVWISDPTGRRIISMCHPGGTHASLDNCNEWFNAQTYPQWFHFTVSGKGMKLWTTTDSQP